MLPRAPIRTRCGGRPGRRTHGRRGHACCALPTHTSAATTRRRLARGQSIKSGDAPRRPRARNKESAGLPRAEHRAGPARAISLTASRKPGVPEPPRRRGRRPRRPSRPSATGCAAGLPVRAADTHRVGAGVRGGVACPLTCVPGGLALQREPWQGSGGRVRPRTRSRVAAQPACCNNYRKPARPGFCAMTWGIARTPLAAGEIVAWSPNEICCRCTGAALGPGCAGRALGRPCMPACLQHCGALSVGRRRICWRARQAVGARRRSTPSNKRC